MVEGKLCLKCENTYVDPTRMYRMCPQCKNYSAMYPRVCISETRVSEYCRALKRSRLWPSLHHDQHCSAQDLADRVSRAKTELDHKCDALSSCPLVKELDKLDEKCQGILYSDPNCESSDTRSSDLKRGDVE